jgi:hypothetical protein
MLTALACYSDFSNTATNLMDIGDFSALSQCNGFNTFSGLVFGANFLPKQRPKTPSHKVSLEIGIRTISRMILDPFHGHGVIRIVSPRPGTIRPKIQWLGTS